MSAGVAAMSVYLLSSPACPGRRNTAGIDFLQAKLEAEKPSAGLRESRAIGIRQDGGLHAQIL